MIEIKTDMVKEFIYKKNYNYVIYIKETITDYECYIQNEDYGIIDLMFGVSKKDYKMQDFVEIVLENVDNYVKIYKNEHED